MASSPMEIDGKGDIPLTTPSLKRTLESVSTQSNQGAAENESSYKKRKILKASPQKSARPPLALKFGHSLTSMLLVDFFKNSISLRKLLNVLNGMNPSRDDLSELMRGDMQDFPRQLRLLSWSIPLTNENPLNKVCFPRLALV